jgi:hypothetical protein
VRELRDLVVELEPDAAAGWLQHIARWVRILATTNRCADAAARQLVTKASYASG